VYEPPKSKASSGETAVTSAKETAEELGAKDTNEQSHDPLSDPAFLVDPRAAELADPVRTTDYTPDQINELGMAGPVASDAPTTAHVVKAVTGSRKGDHDLDLPEKVSGYVILGVLGRGGMGVVYKALQPGLNRLVALKMILAGEYAGRREVARFRSEAEAVAQLQHVNIVQIYEVGEDAGRPYFSLEYIDGVSLSKKVNGTPLPPRQAAELLMQLAHAVEYAHQKGIIHRDIKPANVLLTADGIPKLTDFGLAKRVQDESGQTRTGTVLGTPSYMPPEQAEGRLQEVGPRSDVYSLGAVLYDMLTGRPPFRGTTMLDTLQMVQKQEPVAPTELQPKVPHDLQTICLTCLHKEPARRYASAAALAEDLRRFLAGEPILARLAGAGERLWRWCRRNPRVAALSAALVFLLVIWAITSSALYSIAVRNERKAQENEATAIKEADRAQMNEQKAIEEAARAQANAETARSRQQNAFLAMVSLGGELQKRLRSRRLSEQLGPQARLLQQQLIDVLRNKMLEIAGESESRGVHSFGTVALHQQLGDLLLQFGQGKQALRQYEEGCKIIQKEVQEQPNNDRARANLGIMMMRLGDIALEVNGDAKAARDYYQKGWDLHNEVCVHPHDRDFPAQQKAIVLSHHALRLGRACLAMGRPAEAAKHFEEARKLRQEWALAMARNPESRGYLVEVNMWLGTTAWHREDAKAFTQYFQEALQLMEALIKESPRYVEFKGDLAEVYAAQAEGLTRLGRLDEARTSYQRAWENLKLVMENDPDNPKPLPMLALLHERLGADAQRRGQQPEAHKYYQEALNIRQEFTRLEPENRVCQAAFLLALARCGKPVEAARGADVLRPQAANSAEILLQLARCYAVCASQASEKQGPLSKALETLRELRSLDYHDPVVVRTDPDLALLRTEAAFLALLDKWDKERK